MPPLHTRHCKGAQPLARSLQLLPCSSPHTLQAKLGALELLSSWVCGQTSTEDSCRELVSVSQHNQGWKPLQHRAHCSLPRTAETRRTGHLHHPCPVGWTPSIEDPREPPHSPAGASGTGSHSPHLAALDESRWSQVNCFHTQPRHPQLAKSAILNWDYLQMHWISFSPVLVSSRSYGLDSKNEKLGAFSLEIFLWIRQIERLKASPSFLYTCGKSNPY